MVQFGNGEIFEDGTISAAVKVLPLTSDMAEVENQVTNLPYLKGFTNMAQAFAVAELLHDSIFSLQSCGPIAVGVQSAVSAMCEGWWHSSFEGREQLVTMLVPLLVAKVLPPGGNGSAKDWKDVVRRAAAPHAVLPCQAS